jgi:hypothetical protein
MTSKQTQTDPAAVAVAARIQRGLDLWESGRMTSPDEKDHVLDAEKVLGVELPDEAREQIANEVYEDSGETLTTVEEIAAYVVGRVTEESVRQPLTLDIDDPVRAVYPNATWGEGAIIAVDHDWRANRMKPYIVRRNDGAIGYFHEGQIERITS